MHKRIIQGIGIFAFLILPWMISGCENPGKHSAKRIVYSKNPQHSTAWYIRLSLKNLQTGQRFSGTKFGVLDMDNATQDYSLKAFGSIGSNGMDMVFQDETGVLSGDLLVYYRQAENTERQEWPFTVRSGDINARMALQIEGFYGLTSYIDSEDRIRFTETRTMDDPVLKQMKLVDSETGEEIPVMRKGKPVVYIFDMNGKQTYHFKWVKETEPVQIPLSGNRVFAVKIDFEKRRVSQNIANVSSGVPLNRDKPFDIITPPKAK